MRMLDAISADSQIAVTVGELFAIAGAVGGLIASLVGVYMAGVKRDDAAARRLDDMERWKDEEWNGGPQRKGGFRQSVESLRRWQQEERGADKEKARRITGGYPPQKHPTRGPGHDTQA